MKLLSKLPGDVLDKIIQMLHRENMALDFSCVSKESARRCRCCLQRKDMGAALQLLIQNNPPCHEDYSYQLQFSGQARMPVPGDELLGIQVISPTNFKIGFHASTYYQTDGSFISLPSIIRWVKHRDIHGNFIQLKSCLIGHPHRSLYLIAHHDAVRVLINTDYGITIHDDDFQVIPENSWTFPRFQNMS